MLGSSIRAQWEALRPDDELILLDRADVDLRDSVATARALAGLAPDAVIHAAATVGGIAAKLAAPVPYLMDNLQVDASVIGGALAAGVPELLYIGSAVIYPEGIHRALRPDDLLTGPLEQANEGYGIAKIAGTTLCRYASEQHGVAYRTAVPSNLYGPGDNHAAGSAHLIAAALTKVHDAKEAGSPSVLVWGDGTARREFTFSRDLAQWLVGEVGRLAAWPALLNLGVGHDHSITEFYEIARAVVGYEGDLEYDTTKPAGTPMRLLDSSAARELGWDPSTPLADGMAEVYRSFLTPAH